ncbi:hypothetical protein M404DRAFT_481130 [Pisolithus tinctorius Marx 270]|uniref:Uncharacterized protein n=1 Tax=Pisolithus tinctorius Marx 270 TaxID=870435 RepID=A0A0C3PE16_PISTI|nr:hypothetical protein M404DRAFT_481130 [Pisolithus tinctorius Marx 270]
MRTSLEPELQGGFLICFITNIYNGPLKNGWVDLTAYIYRYHATRTSGQYDMSRTACQSRHHFEEPLVSNEIFWADEGVPNGDLGIRCYPETSL